MGRAFFSIIDINPTVPLIIIPKQGISVGNGPSNDIDLHRSKRPAVIISEPVADPFVNLPVQHFFDCVTLLGGNRLVRFPANDEVKVSPVIKNLISLVFGGSGLSQLVDTLSALIVNSVLSCPKAKHAGTMHNKILNANRFRRTL
jgi:hypothetical protein